VTLFQQRRHCATAIHAELQHRTAALTTPRAPDNLATPTSAMIVTTCKALNVPVSFFGFYSKELAIKRIVDVFSKAHHSRKAIEAMRGGTR
jgi:hypothetical protein